MAFKDRWWADLFCPDCRTETEHDFVRDAGTVTAWCMECDYETTGIEEDY